MSANIPFIFHLQFSFRCPVDCHILGRTHLDLGDLKACLALLELWCWCPEKQCVVMISLRSKESFPNQYKLERELSGAIVCCK
jgi:hypothetical protein